MLKVDSKETGCDTEVKNGG